MKRVLIGILILFTLYGNVCAGVYSDFLQVTDRVDTALAAPMASAATVEIGYANGNTIHITGTTTITSLGSARQAGVVRTLIFDDSLTLTHSASLVLPGAFNIQTTAGDKAVFVAEEFNVWELVTYTTGDGSYASIRLRTDAGEPVSPVQGEFYWNADEETADLILNGAVLQLGQEMHYHVRNNTVSTIADCTPVMATGSLGASGRITVAPMDGTVSSNAMYMLGIATEEIIADDDGKVTMFGKIRGCDTTGTPYGEVWSDGDVIWVSGDTIGYLTNVEPTEPKIGMPVAFVVSKHATVGTLAVRVTPLDEHEHLDRVSGDFNNISGVQKTDHDVSGGGTATINYTDGNSHSVAVNGVGTATITKGTGWDTTYSQWVTLHIDAAATPTLAWSGWSFENTPPTGAGITSYAIYEIRLIDGKYYIITLLEG